MSFDINSKIVTELTHEDVAIIATALGFFQEGIRDKNNDISQHATRLCNRLGDELHNVQTKKNSKK